MNEITFLEQDNVAFLRTPKFLRRLATPHAAELYALLRERRGWLVQNKKIKNHSSWFFFPTRDLQKALLPPNSLNHLKVLLKMLENLELIEINIDNYPPFRKHYKINEEVYFSLAKQEALKLTKKIDTDYDKFQDESNN